MTKIIKNAWAYYKPCTQNAYKICRQVLKNLRHLNSDYGSGP